MAGPGGEIAAGAGGRGRLRASHADREHVIGTLKAAFVQGRLTKDEFDARVGQTFAARTYAELAAVTADLPAGLAGDQLPRKPGRGQARPPMGNAAKAGTCVVIALVTMVAAAFATDGLALALFVPFYFMALLVAGAQLLAWRYEKRPRGRQPPRPAPRAGGSRRTASAGAGQPPQINQARPHTADAARSRLRRPRSPGSRPPQQWRGVTA